MLYITGDLHRDFTRFKHMDLTEDDLVIVLGDVDLNYYLDFKDIKKKQKISKMPCSWFFIRGNHEERPENIPTYKLQTVERIVRGKVYMEAEFPKLMFAAEGLYEIGGYRCFVTNGAYSVDKAYRLAFGWQWFKDEELTDEEMVETLEKAQQAGVVDFVLSHTCPARYLPTHALLEGIDQSKVSHRMEEFLDELADTLDYRRWWCGHFHIDWVIDNVQFMYKDIMEL